MTNFDDFLAEVHTVAIGGHIRPDGDCVGSCLATYNYIKTWYPDIDVTVYLEPIPNIFKIGTAIGNIVLHLLFERLNRCKFPLAADSA